MRSTVRLIASIAALLLALSQASSHAGQESVPAPSVRQLGNTAPERVLFIGNSYLYYNDSVHNHVRRIAEEIGPHAAGDYQYKSATIGGASLSQHHIDHLLEPGRLRVDKPFDLVVLQGGSGEVLSERRRAGFRETASEMAAKIRATGAEVALYMVHAYVEPHEDFDPGMTDQIERTYVAAGNELGVLVIPVGLAFQRAYARRPGIRLHKRFDGTHPDMLGTYLAACVVFQSIYGRPVTDSNYDYFGAVDKDTAAFLRGIADETVRAFYAGRQ